jgi:Domain of unknown function (DUF4386)
VRTTSAALRPASNLGLGAGAAVGFGVAESTAFVMPMAEIGRGATLVAGMFWGLWLVPLGFLVMKSAALPRVIGALLIVGGFSLPANLSLAILTGRGVPFLLVLDAGEVFFVVWLLVKGAMVPPTGSPLAASTPRSRALPRTSLTGLNAASVPLAEPEGLAPGLGQPGNAPTSPRRRPTRPSRRP